MKSKCKRVIAVLMVFAFIVCNSAMCFAASSPNYAWSKETLQINNP